jgi:hypothetical protein
MSSSPFAFYEVVIIQSSRPELREIAGEHAVIVGTAQEAGHWSYSVWIESRGTTWSLGASDIRSTGEIRKREEFYDGHSIRVSKDGQLLD